MSKYARSVAGFVAMTSLATIGVEVTDAIFNSEEADAISQDALDELGTIKQMLTLQNGIIALMTNGDVYVGGYNSYNTMGVGSYVEVSPPQKVAEGVSKIAYNDNANSDYIEKLYLIKNDGTVFFAGYGNNNYNYSSGTGSTSDCPNFTEINITNIEDIYATNNETVFISKDGQAYLVDYDNRTPTLVNGVSDVKKVFFTRGTVYYLTEDGKLYGGGDYGAYNESGTQGTDPLNPIYLTDNVKKVVGYQNQMVLKNDGTLWGCNGMIGNGESSVGKVPVEVTSDVKDLYLFDDGYGGAWYINNSGELYYAGYTNSGLGTGISNSSRLLSFTRVPIYESVKSIYSRDYTTFFVCDGGNVYVSGDNLNGELGTGDASKTTLAKVSDLTNIDDISISNNTCIGRDKTNGEYKVWGKLYNSDGKSLTGGLFNGSSSTRFTPQSISSLYLKRATYTLDTFSTDLDDYYRFGNSATYLSGLSKFDANVYGSNLPIEVKYSTNNTSSASLGSLDADMNDVKLIKYLIDGSRVVIDNYGSIQYYAQGSTSPTSIAMDGTDIVDVGNSMLDKTIVVSLYKSDGSIYYFDPASITKPKMLPITQDEYVNTFVIKASNCVPYLFVYEKADGDLVYFNSSRAEVSLGVNRADIKDIIESSVNTSNSTTLLMNDGTVKYFDTSSLSFKDTTLPDGVKMISALSNTYFLGDDGFVYGHNYTSFTDSIALNSAVSSVCNNVLCLKNGTTCKLKGSSLTTVTDVNSKLMKSLVKLDEDNLYVLMKDDSTYGIGNIIEGDLYDSGIEYSDVVAFISNNSVYAYHKYLVLKDGSVWGYDTSSKKWVRNTVICLDNSALTYAKQANPVSFDANELIESLVKKAEDGRYTDTSSDLKSKYDSALSAVTSSGADTTHMQDWNDRLSKVLDYYNNLSNAETLVENAEASPSTETISTARTFITNADNLKQDATNTLSLLARLDALSDTVVLNEAKVSVDEAERCMKEELQTPMISAYNDAKTKVDALSDSSEKTSLLSRLGVVKTYHDSKFKPAEDSLVDLETSVSDGITSSNLDSIKSKYTTTDNLIKNLNSTSDYKNTVTLRNRLNAIDTSIKEFESNSSLNEAIISVTEAERAMREEYSTPMLNAYSSAKEKVDNLPSGTDKEDLLSRLTVVKTYHDSKFNPAEDSVVELESLISGSEKDLDDIKSKYASATDLVSQLNQDSDFTNTEKLKDRLKVVNNYIKSEESNKLSVDISEAERCMREELSTPMLNAYISAKEKVDNLDTSDTNKSGYLVRLQIVKNYHDNKFKPAEDSVLDLESLGTITDSNIDEARDKLSIAKSKISLLEQTLDYTNTETLRNRLLAIENNIDDVDTKKDSETQATLGVEEAERCMKEELSTPMLSAYTSALSKVNALSTGTVKTNLLSRLHVVKNYHDNKFNPAEVKVVELQGLASSISSSNIDEVKTKYTEAVVSIDNLEQDYINTTTLRNALQDISDNITSYESSADAELSIAEAERAMREELSSPMLNAYTTAKSKVDALSDSNLNKSAYLLRLQIVKNYLDNKFNPAEASVIELENLGVVTKSNLVEAKTKLAEVNSKISVLEQTSDYVNTQALKDRAKLISDSIRDLEGGIEAGDEAKIDVSEAERCMKEELSAPMLNAYNTAKLKVDALSDSTTKTELLNRLAVVKAYHDNKFNPAETEVIELEELIRNIGSDNISDIKAKYTSANQAISNLEQTSDYINTKALKDRLISIDNTIKDYDSTDDADADVSEAERAMKEELSTPMLNAYTQAKSTVDALPSTNTNKANLLNRLITVKDYHDTRFKPAEDKVKEVEDLISSITTSNVDSVRGKYNSALASVNSLEQSVDFINTKTLRDRLSIVDSSITAIEEQKDKEQSESEVEALVEKAESLRYTDTKTNFTDLKDAYDTARTSVNNLQDGTKKGELSDRLDSVDSYYNRLIDAEVLVNKAETSSPLSQSDVDTAREYILDKTASPSLKEDAVNTQALLNRLKVVEDTINGNDDSAKLGKVQLEIDDLLALRYTDTSTNYTVLRDKITSTRAKVNALDSKFSNEKTEFLNTIYDVDDYRDILLEAERLVIISEQANPKSQDLVSIAKTYITTSALKQDATNTLELLSRLKTVEDTILRENKDNAEELVRVAENGRYTDKSDDLLTKHDKADEAVNKLEDGAEKEGLANRLKTVKDYQGVLAEAESKVDNAESVKTQESIDEARNYITSSILKQDAPNTVALLNRLQDLEDKLNQDKDDKATIDAVQLDIDDLLALRYTDVTKNYTALQSKIVSTKAKVNALDSSKFATEKNNFLSTIMDVIDYRDLLLQAETKVINAETSPKSQEKVDTAREFITTSSLKQDAPNTVALLNRLTDVEADLEDDKEHQDKVNEVESYVRQAEEARYTGSSDNLKGKYDIADEKVIKLGVCDEQQGFKDRLANVLDYYNKLKEAENKVTACENESPKSQTSVNGARKYINSNLKSDAKNTKDLLARLDDIDDELTYGSNISNIEDLIKKAENGRYTDYAKDLKDKYDKAKSEVEKLGSSDSNYASFTSRLDNVLDYYNKLSQAENLVETAETDLTSSSVTTARSYINSNLEPTAINTQALLNRLRVVDDIIAGNDSLREASEAVKKAEDTMTYTDFNKAQDLVTALDPSDGKDALQDRLDVLKDKMQKLLDEAKKAVDDAEANPSTDTITNGYGKVNKLPDDCSEKQGLLDRLGVLKDNLNKGDKIAEAEKAVEKAEKTKAQVDVDSARPLVDALEDGQTKTDLSDRLDAVQDYIDKLKDATSKVEKAEDSLKQDDVDKAQESINSLPNDSNRESLQERLDEVQRKIDNLLSEATKAVEKAEETLSKTDYNTADKLVNALDDSNDKDNLRARLDEVLNKVNTLISDATKKVEDAEANPSRDLVNIAQESIDKIPSDYPEKQELQDRLNDVIAKLDEKDLEDLATKAVEKAESTKDLDDINSAQDLVNKLPDGDLKDELQERIDKLLDDLNLQDLINKATEAVEKAEDERTQKSKDDAQKLVDLLPAGDIKNELQDRLDAIIIGSETPSKDYTEAELQEIFKKVVDSCKATNDTYMDSLIDEITQGFKDKTGVDISVSINGFEKSNATTSSNGSIKGTAIGVVTLSNGNSAQLIADMDKVIDKLQSTSSDSSSSSHSSKKSNSTTTTYGSGKGVSFTLLGITRSDIASDVEVLGTEQATASEDKSLLSNEDVELKVVNVPYLEKITTEDGSVNGTMQLLNAGDETIGMVLTGDKEYSNDTVVSIRTDANADDLSVYTYIDELDKYVKIDTDISKDNDMLKFRGTGKNKYVLSTVDLSNTVTVDQGWNKLDGENWTYVQGQDVSTNWVTDTDSKKYYIDSNTYEMQDGWLQQGNDWYFLNPISDGYRGAMKTGWQSTKTDWYYMGEDGKMKTGWLQDGSTWYYLNPISNGNKGAMAKGWKQIDGQWYYFNSDGSLAE